MKRQIILPLAAMLIASPVWARTRSGSSISLSTKALSFNGSTGNTSSQPLTITSTGYRSVSIQKLTFSNSAFSNTSVSLPITLAKGQSLTIQVAAHPESSAEAGTLTITTSAGSSTVSLSETAITQQVSHQVSLTWQAPASGDAVDSYQVDRAVSGSTSYSVVGSTTAGSPSFTDSAVSPGTSYVYEVRSVDQNGNVSSPSNTITLAIP